MADDLDDLDALLDAPYQKVSACFVVRKVSKCCRGLQSF